MHKSQLLFIILVSFIVGIALGSFVEIPALYLRMAFIPPLVAIGVAWRRSWKTVFGALVAAVFVFGLLRIGNFGSASTFLQHFADNNFKTTVYGYIDSEPAQKGVSQEFVFRVKKIKTPDDFIIPEAIDEKILVIADTYPRRTYGEKLSLSGSIKLPKSYDDFDYIAYLAKDQIFTILFRPDIQTITPPMGFTERLRLNFLGVFLV
jgi:competence protein ComEC